MLYKLRIKTNNKIFVIKGKPIRTPLVIDNLTKQDLNFYLTKIRLEGIMDKDYSIEEMTTKSYPKITKINREKDKTKEDDKNVDSEDKTFLDSILDSE